MRLRKTTVTAMLVLALIAACGNDDNPTGGNGTGSGDNTPTTAVDVGTGTGESTATTAVDDGY